MLGSAVLETAIGLVFIFLLLSLACTAAKEVIEIRFKRRSVHLEQAIRELLEDPEPGLPPGWVRSIVRVTEVLQFPAVGAWVTGIWKRFLRPTAEAAAAAAARAEDALRRVSEARQRAAVPTTARAGAEAATAGAIPPSSVPGPTQQELDRLDREAAMWVKAAAAWKPVQAAGQVRGADGTPASPVEESVPTAEAAAGPPATKAMALATEQAAEADWAWNQAQTGLVARTYNHPLVRGLVVGRYDPKWCLGGPGSRWYAGGNLPAYIPSRTFALALMDVILPGAADQQPSGAAEAVPPPAGMPDQPGSPVLPTDPLGRLRQAVQRIPAVQTRQALLALIDAAGGNVAQARANIEAWFDAAMDRVSGLYKRWTQQIIFLLGLTLVIALNVDAIAVGRRLWLDQPLREAVVAAAKSHVEAEAGRTKTAPGGPGKDPKDDGKPKEKAKDAAPGPDQGKPPPKKPETEQNPNTGGAPTDSDPAERYKEIEKKLLDLAVPIGWEKGNYPETGITITWWGPPAWAWYGKALGWLITALAISLGAPFWFDLLNKIMVVRSSVKPQEKEKKEGSGAKSTPPL